MNSAPTLAERRWAANVAANGHALAATQPAVVRALRQDLPPALTPVFARDGSLTAFVGDGERWWSGCSLPRRAAQAMLKRLDPRGGTSCFLGPPHAAHLRVALDRGNGSRAVVAVLPDRRDLAVLLGCEDFSADLRAGRLWFASGEDWPAVLERIFADHPGLPTPQQFVRLPTTPDDEVQRLIPPAQRVFAAETARRATLVSGIHDGWRPPVAGAMRRVCVVAPSRFELWNDAGRALADALVGSKDSNARVAWEPIDVDCPTRASPVAFAQAATAAGAVVSADVARADWPNLLPPTLPWLTWVTAGRVPPFAPAGPLDGLLLADPAWRQPAREAGWPDARLAVAGWPIHGSEAPENNTPDTFAAIVCDTVRPEPDERVTDFSSHQLLWDAIAEELLRDPFVVGGGNVDRYLDERVRRAGLDGDALDRRQFVQGLIAPTYAQGIARALLRAGVPLRIFGRGWDALDAFRPYHGGVVSSRDELIRITRGTAALIHVWPSAHAHPIDALGRPVVRPSPAGGERFLRDVRTALAGATPLPASRGEPVSADVVMRLLRTCDARRADFL